MLKVNKKTEYALMAIRFMWEKGKDEMVSAREVCDHFNTPFDTTAKVMQAMNSHEILKSHKGIKGGYTLAKDLPQITYWDLSKIVEGRKEIEIQNFCQTHKGICELHDQCNIVSPLERLNQKLNLFLKKLTLDELFYGNSGIEFPQNREQKE